MKKYLQRELAALYIVEAQGRWVHAWQLKQAPFVNGQKLGSEGDRRALDLFPVDPSITTVDVEIRGVKYTIERGWEGKYRTYRLISAPPPKYKLTYDPQRDIMVQELVV